MNKLDNQIIRSAKRLAQRECANYCVECETAAKQARSMEKQHRYRARKKMPTQRYLLEQKRQGKTRLPGHPGGQDDILVILPHEDEKMSL